MQPTTPDGWQHLIEQVIERSQRGRDALATETVEAFFKREPEVLWVYAGGNILAIPEKDLEAIASICRLMPVRPRTDPPKERDRMALWHPRRSDAYEVAYSSDPRGGATLRAARIAARRERPSLAEFLSEAAPDESERGP